MHKICMLLNGEIKNDNRVIKMIRTLSQKSYIDLYYVNGVDTDNSIFNKNVTLYSHKYKDSFRRKIIQHSFFIWEFNFFYSKVLYTEINYDYIWCNDLPTLNPGIKISKKLNAKLIFDSHEIYLETLNQFFPRNSKGLKKIFFEINLRFMKYIGNNFSQKAIPKVDTFITVNQSLEHYFCSKYSIKNHVVIMNFPMQDTEENSINFRQMFNWKKEDKILIYQGALNEGRGLHTLIETVNNLDNKFKLIIIGNGPLKPYLQGLVQNKNNIKFLNSVPIEELLFHTRGADIGINLLEDFNLSKKLASPNKLFEYIQAKIPVICSNTIENQKILEKYNIGILTENNMRSLRNSIMNLSYRRSDQFTDELSKSSSEFHWKNQEFKVIEIIDA